MTEPMAGERYRHYKGGIYTVVGTASHTETGERMVVYYRPEVSPDIWIRPLAMFQETMPDGRRRFVRQP